MGPLKRPIEVDHILAIWRMKDNPPKIFLAETARVISMGGMKGWGTEEIHC